MANTKHQKSKAHLSDADRARLERIRKREQQARRSKVGIHTRSVKVPTKRTKVKRPAPKKAPRHYLLRQEEEEKVVRATEEEQEHKYDDEEDDEEEKKDDILAHAQQREEEIEQKAAEQSFSEADIRHNAQAAQRAQHPVVADDEDTEDEDEDEEQKEPPRMVPKAPRKFHEEIIEEKEEDDEDTEDEDEEEQKEPPRMVPKAPRRKLYLTKSARKAGMSVKKTHRARSGVKALRNIRKYQKTSRLMFQKKSFQNFVRQRSLDIGPMRFEGLAIVAVQEQIEAWIVSVLMDENLGALHSRRVTVLIKDVAFVDRINNHHATMVPDVLSDEEIRRKYDQINDWKRKELRRGKTKKTYVERNSPMTGMKTEAFKRLARRAGVKRIQPSVFNELRWKINELIKVWAFYCMEYIRLKRTQTVTLQDSLHALKQTFGTSLWMAEKSVPLLLDKKKTTTGVRRKSQVKSSKIQHHNNSSSSFVPTSVAVAPAPAIEEKKQEHKEEKKQEPYLSSSADLLNFVNRNLNEHHIHTEIINLDSVQLAVPASYANNRAEQRKVHEDIAKYLWNTVLKKMNGIYPYVKNQSRTLCDLDNDSTSTLKDIDNRVHNININNAIVGLVRQYEAYEIEHQESHRWLQPILDNAAHFIQKLRVSHIVCIMKEENAEGKVVGFGFFRVLPAKEWHIHFEMDPFDDNFMVMSIEALCAFGSVKGLAWYLLEKTMLRYNQQHKINVQFATVLIQNNRDLLVMYDRLGFARLARVHHDDLEPPLNPRLHTTDIAVFDNKDTKEEYTERLLLNSNDFIGPDSLFTTLPVPQIINT